MAIRESRESDDLPPAIDQPGEVFSSVCAITETPVRLIGVQNPWTVHDISRYLRNA
jgi:hypothetical protein